MIKMGVVGSQGRMGQAVLAVIEQDKDVQLTAAFSRSKGNMQALAKEIAQAKMAVLIDFTPPEIVLETLSLCKNHKVPMVIGSTGFTEAEKKTIQEAAKVFPIVLAPNMSIGVNVAYKLLEIAAHVLKDQAEIAILDIHHKNKKDAPSGTALKMAEVMAKAKDTPLKEANIPISSLRIGDTLGEHSVLFALNGEQIKIQHQTFDRAIYASGAVTAAKWLVKKQLPGLYDMQDVLGFR